MERLALVLALFLVGAPALAQPPISRLLQPRFPPEIVPESLYVQRAYAQAMAAERVAEIYEKGIGGVVRDIAQSQKWYSAARALRRSEAGR